MTRINLIDPSLLCDQHLLAEHRELTRIPNKVAVGKYKDLTDVPERYTVRTEDNPNGGKGHEKFFVDKLDWLHHRYQALHNEAHRRGFNVQYKWPDDVSRSTQWSLWNWYEPSLDDIRLNFKRIVERTPKEMRYMSEPASDHYVKIKKLLDLPAKPKLTYKRSTGTMVCGHGCNSDFVIVKGGNVECASCGTVYGNIKGTEL